jgi:hypothetical protein
MVAPTKSPSHVNRGRAGARKRWAGHAPVVVRLSSLPENQRRLIAAMVDAARAQAERSPDPTTERSPA